LWVLWDVIRNGQAHFYQQITIQLSDSAVYVRLAGADYGRLVGHVIRAYAAGHRPTEHLKTGQNENGEIWIRLFPEILFLDIRAAVRGARLWARELSIPPVASAARRSLDISAGELAGELAALTVEA